MILYNKQLTFVNIKFRVQLSSHQILKPVDIIINEVVQDFRNIKALSHPRPLLLHPLTISP